MFNIFKAKIKPVKYSNEDIINNPAICRFSWVYPVINFGQQAVRQCCRTPMMKVSAEEVEKYKDQIFLNHPKHQKRRLEMIQGIKHTDCNSCWQLEDAHARSAREPFSNIEEFKFHTQPKNEIVAEHPWKLDIEIGNLCNMKCMYCSRLFSTSWANEDLKLNKITFQQLQNEANSSSENFEKYFWAWFEQIKVDLKFLNFIGGEPTINPQYYSFLKKIKLAFKDLPNNQLKISTVSNLNTNEKEFSVFIETIKDLTGYFRFELYVSQDSFEQRSEFIRYGQNWSLWEKNLNHVLAQNFENFHLGLIISINILNLKNLSIFIEKIIDIRSRYTTPIYFQLNTVSDPSYFSPLIGTIDMADDLRNAANLLKSKADLAKTSFEKNNWIEYTKFLVNISESILIKQKDENYLTAQRTKFYSWLVDYEKNRSVNFLKIFPEYFDFYMICKLTSETKKKAT